MNNNSILIVDDNPADIFITEKAITKVRPGSVIEQADDGAKAIDLLRTGNVP